MGTPRGHRRYHQAVVDRAELVNQILRATLIHVVKYGAFAGLIWMFWALAHAWKLEILK